MKTRYWLVPLWIACGVLVLSNQRNYYWENFALTPCRHVVPYADKFECYMADAPWWW